MTAIPDRREQIRRVHARFICQVVETCANPNRCMEFEALLSDAEQSGWQALASALRRVAAGERSPTLFAALDEEDQVIAESILHGLHDPSSLPDPETKSDPTLAAPGLAHMIQAAGRGNAEALVLIGNMAEQMSRVGGGMGRLAAVIRPMINGERNPEILCKGTDAKTKQLVLDILGELGKLDSH